MCSMLSHSVLSDSLRLHGLQPTRLLHPCDFPGKSTGVGYHCLLHLFRYYNIILPDIQAGFRKGRRTRDQIANIRWIMEKAREFQKNIYFCFIDYAKAFDCVDHNKLENSERDGNIRPPDLPLEKPICSSGSNS